MFVGLRWVTDMFGNNFKVKIFRNVGNFVGRNVGRKCLPTCWLVVATKRPNIMTPETHNPVFFGVCFNLKKQSKVDSCSAKKKKNTTLEHFVLYCQIGSSSWFIFISSGRIFFKQCQLLSASVCEKHISSFSRPVICKNLVWQNLKGLVELFNLTVFIL